MSYVSFKSTLSHHPPGQHQGHHTYSCPGLRDIIDFFMKISDVPRALGWGYHRQTRPRLKAKYNK